MKNFKILTFALFLTLAMAWQPISNAAPDNGPSASGHGNLTAGGELRTFSFTAVTHKDGTVTGEAELDNRSTGNTIHLSINCLTVSGNKALVSGVVTNSHGPDDFVGWIGTFEVIDNGEGANDPADRISLVFLFSPPTTISCTSFMFSSFSTSPIEAGNIQVNP
jgi:hypothetical protein